MQPARQKKLAVVGVVAVVVMLAGLGGCRRKPAARAPAPAPPAIPGESETGLASWYGDPYHGRATASGEIYDKMKFTAAHRTLPFHTWVRVTNLENGRLTTVRINDRGPFIEGRIVDLSLAAAETLDMVRPGTALVRLDIIQKPTTPAGSRGRFAVQVGAFRQRPNAERMRDHLGRTFRDVFIQTYDAPDGRYFRVRVGAPTEQEAIRLAARLRQDPAVSSSFVVRVD